MSSKRARASPAPGEQGKRPKIATIILKFPVSFSQEDKDESKVALQWSKQVPRVYISCNGHNAVLLPGINCKGNMLYVQCCCSQRCKPAADAAGAAAASSSSSRSCKLFGLEDWVEAHAGGPVIPGHDDAAAERLVRSAVSASSSGWGGQDTQPLGAFLAGHSRALGGQALVGRGVCLDWGGHNAGPDDEGPGARGWYAGRLVAYDPTSGEYTVKYHSDDSMHPLIPAIARLHWGSKPPTAGSKPQVALPQPMGCLARRVLRQQATRQQALVLGLLRVGRVMDAQQRPCQRP
ncbi:hypothetical protein OEZ86_005032 [Tetradesmus obliquus]|nr:hypothetical protein OEZ86_005032 [Tetradesmus obliquus]